MNTTNVPAVVPVTRKGSGRTKGSFSFVNITLADLNKKFADQNIPVRVSRIWAQQLGFEALTTSCAKDLESEIQGKTPTTAIAAVVVDLNAE